MKKIKVLIVDDSALVRQILRKGFGEYSNIEVVGAAADPYMARDMIVQYRPDVMTLDVEMPKMNGLEFLRRLMPQFPMPVLMVSSLTEKGSDVTMNALELGAFDFVTKPSSNIKSGLSSMVRMLVEKIELAYDNKERIKKRILNKPKMVSQKITSLKTTTDKIVAIGASTGGTEAIAQVLSCFPEDFPGIVIVQHMPVLFTKSFAERLNKLSRMEVKEAADNDRILQGRVLIAEGGKQLRVVRSGGHYIVRVEEGELVSGHCPSVDVLFKSVAKEAGSNAIGVLLTGMGKDGAIGMKEMSDVGSITVAQNEDTCVVYGMPKAAVDTGAAKYIKPLDEIAMFVHKSLKGFR